MDPESQGAVIGVSMVVRLPLAVWYRNQYNMQRNLPLSFEEFRKLIPPSLERPTQSFTLPLFCRHFYRRLGWWLRTCEKRQKKAGYFPRGQGVGSRRFPLLWLTPNHNPVISGCFLALLRFREILFELPVHGESKALPRTLDCNGPSHQFPPSPYPICPAILSQSHTP